MTNLTLTPDARPIREQIQELIEETIGAAAKLDDDVLIAYDLGLESIEIVALLDVLRERFGVRIEVLGPTEDLQSLFDQLSIGWIVAQSILAMRSNSVTL